MGVELSSDRAFGITGSEEIEVTGDYFRDVESRRLLIYHNVVVCSIVSLYACFWMFLDDDGKILTCMSCATLELSLFSDSFCFISVFGFNPFSLFL